ncbi:MAG: PQQ-dependent sugar dehydrogenase [Anaerolineales bacterium]|nr:PQQ-dependent sugar dehydrogenase [Anaerolineales bacterium]
MKTQPLLALTLSVTLAILACSPAVVSTSTAPPPTAAADTPASPPPTPAAGTATTPPTAGAATDAPPDAPATVPPTAAPVTGGPETVDPADYTFQLVAEGFADPVLVTHAGDGSGRLFVVEKVGSIRILRPDGTVLPDPFYDMTGQVSQDSEQGLLGLAFSPRYAEDGAFFINYTDLNGDTHVDRCHVSGSDPNQGGDCATLLFVPQPAWNHNGGHLAFGPDGYLYIGLGDGGDSNDPDDRAQNLNDRLGKLLRLDVSGDEAAYSPAPGNPFSDQGGAAAEVWAYGLRNPWRWSFDRATGDLYIGDVGQNAFEELDYQPASSAGGENYGWPYLEALRVNTEAPRAAPDGFSSVPPLVNYAQEVGGCSIVGGYVYRGRSLPELNGVYFFGDYCTGNVWTLPAATPDPAVTQWPSTGFNISSFGEDEAGELYAVDLNGGVYRLVRAGG